MANIKKSATELIGHTPLLELVNFQKAEDVKDAKIIAKLEYLNPAGSVKDRVAYAMIVDAEKSGKLMCWSMFSTTPRNWFVDWRYG